MKRLGRSQSALLAVALLAIVSLPARGADGSAAKLRAPVRIGDRGVIALGQGPSGHGPWHGFPISVSLRDAPLPEVLRTFARLAGFNLVLDSSVQGSVTVELNDVPWDQALALILKVHGLAAEVDGQLWLVSPQ
jgi:type II secretory pathway component GspD/PulD (secretin)